MDKITKEDISDLVDKQEKLFLLKNKKEKDIAVINTKYSPPITQYEQELRKLKNKLVSAAVHMLHEKLIDERINDIVETFGYCPDDVKRRIIREVDIEYDSWCFNKNYQIIFEKYADHPNDIGHTIVNLKDLENYEFKYLTCLTS